MRKMLTAVLALLMFGVLSLVGAGQADAASYSKQVNFALGCTLKTGQFARIDFTNIRLINRGFARGIDADRITYSSLAGDGRTPASFRPERVMIEVYGQSQVSPDGWTNWTGIGGQIDDKALVASGAHWNPGGKFLVSYAYGMVRLRVHGSGTSCVTPGRLP